MLPSLPQRDVNGNTLPHDHPEILASDGIIRRVNPEHHIVDDPKSITGKRISSQLLKSRGGVSVDLLRPMQEDGIDAQVFVIRPPYLGAIKFIANDLREAGFQIGYDPIPKNHPADPENPYHGLLWGSASSGKLKALLSKAEWFVTIEGVSLG